MPNELNNECCQETRPQATLRTLEPCGSETELPMDSSKMYNISIHALDFGYNVKIGCQNFAVETSEKLIKNLEAYLKDPKETERKWMRNKELL